MRKKLRFAPNIRFDLPDADAVHGLVDASLRGLAELFGYGGAVGLSVPGGGSWDTTGIVISGWTVAHNADDNQQVLITPGLALCSELDEAGVLQWGQVTTPSDDPVVLVIGGALTTKHIWVRFLYRAGETRTRARWRPDLSPASERTFPHDTRLLAGAQVQATDTNSPPEAGQGWFRIAEVDYSSGAIDASKIKDRRLLLFEGQATGSANPSTDWVIPTVSVSASRGVNGARDLHGFAMRALAAIKSIKGSTKWFYTPNFGENLRSASAAVTAGKLNAADPGSVHLNLASDAGDLRDQLVTILSDPTFLPAAGADAPDRHRADVQFLLSQASNARETLSIDTTDGAVPGPGAKPYRVTLRGQVVIRRTAGGNAILDTTDAELWGELDGLQLEAGHGTAPIIELGDDDDDVILTGVVLTTTAGVKPGALLKVSGAGRVVLRDAQLIATDKTATDLIQVSGGATVVLVNCLLSTALRGINDTGGSGQITAIGCRFHDLDVGAKSARRTITTIGCSFTSITTADFEQGGDFQPAGGFSHRGGHFAGPVVATTLRASGSILYHGHGLGRLLLADVLSGAKAAGAAMDASFGRVWSSAKAFLFGAYDSAALPTTTRPRITHLAESGDGPERFALLDGASETAPGTPLHASSLILGTAPGNRRNELTYAMIPQAWGVAKLDASAKPDEYQVGGRRNDGQALTITYDRVTIDGTSNNRWRVQGLGLADTGYMVVASISVEISDMDHIYPGSVNAEGITYDVMVHNRTSDAFYLLPTMLSGTGQRQVMEHNALDPALGGYSISFLVFSLSAGGLLSAAAAAP